MPVNIHWEVITRHDLNEGIRPSHHESISDLVVSRLLISEHSTTGTMSSLIIVVVDERQAVVAWDESPSGAEVLQVRQSLVVSLGHDVAQVHTVLELGNSAEVSVVGVLDWLAAHVDDFLVDEWTFSRTENTICISY